MREIFFSGPESQDQTEAKAEQTSEDKIETPLSGEQGTPNTFFSACLTL
jgi:hypothetical protein